MEWSYQFYNLNYVDPELPTAIKISCPPLYSPFPPLYGCIHALYQKYWFEFRQAEMILFFFHPYC